MTKLSKKFTVVSGAVFLALALAAGLSFIPVSAAVDHELHLPAGYSYQIMVSEGMALPGGGTFGANNDLLAFTPIKQDMTYLTVNHETQPGGMSVLILKKNAGVWRMVGSRTVDFSSVGGTWNNCAGNPTPWGTVLSAEEYPPNKIEDFGSNVEALKDKGISLNPLDYGWILEVNPLTGRVFKHRAMGRFSHEGAVVMPDRKTVYMGDDFRGGMIFKFVADRPADLSDGTLYALDAKNRKWLEIPKDQLENARAAAARLGATGFDRPEDIEYNPVDGNLYIAETGDSRKQGNDRFGRVLKLNPSTLEVAVFIQGSLEGIVNPDNLAIEPGTGRIYVHEDRYDEFMAPAKDMPNNSLWVAELNGNISRFATMPLGAEVTGGAFAPDGTLFFNVQHPDKPWTSSVVQVFPPAK